MEIPSFIQIMGSSFLLPQLYHAILVYNNKMTLYRHKTSVKWIMNKKNICNAGKEKKDAPSTDHFWQKGSKK